MMETDFTPRPTEYRGVLFKSKSEAKYARLLDIVQPEIGWAYEPKDIAHILTQITNSNYCPDFVGFVAAPGNRGFLCAVVEYKPKRPTDAYIREFFGVRCKYVQDALSPIVIVPIIHCVDFWGRSATQILNPQSTKLGVSQFLPAYMTSKDVIGPEYVSSWDEVDQTGEYQSVINEVNNYRFDIKQ